ncbi:nucleotidyl transferase AbiEii/AbiGii toxin family protein [Candidatus Rariloculus sp.]|uniref:nucleotidyl transferase AbiEii/AbiGii toxin family protein n=1 Tax=Candidatus Rariloculus sp. TaxID=3101265 RepID=UPI003D0B33BB
MIPAMHIIAWSSVAPWAAPRQVEQDLIISRAVVELFSDEFLKKELRFRGGTALHKLHFPRPLRYSEDIDLVRMTAGGIGPVLDRVRRVLGWLGEASYESTHVAPKLHFRTDAQDGRAELRLKVEINTREREIHDAPIEIGHTVDNPWFTGHAAIPTYSPEEMLTTKLRALLQRNKGRDLFDLAHGLAVFEALDTGHVVDLFVRYLDQVDQAISRSEAESRMFAKLAKPGFVQDIRPLLAVDEAAALTDDWVLAAFSEVFGRLIERLPGERWTRTDEMAERFGVVLGSGG